MSTSGSVVHPSKPATVAAGSDSGRFAARVLQSPAMPTREQTRADTREALIEAALGTFVGAGLDAPLDEICRRAGYTRGAFYVHFPDRDALILAVVEQIIG